MTITLLTGDCREVLKTLPDRSVHCCITSPPYFNLRSYLDASHADKALEIGSEASPAAYVAELVAVFREIWRVLRDDGCAFVNLGDGFASSGTPGPNSGLAALADRHAPRVNPRNPNRDDRGEVSRAQKTVPSGLKAKDLLMMPARVAIALCEDGWYLRQQMPWVKRGCMPESVDDRPANAVEYVYQLAKQPTYFYDNEAVKRAGAIQAGTRAAKGGNVRSALNDVNGRPPEYWEYTGKRNFRNSDLFFDSLSSPWGAISNEDGIIALDVNTQAFASAHFAVWPEKLVEPLIKAGTSEIGCCPNCAAPWERVVGDKHVVDARGSGNGFKRDARLSYEDANGSRGDDTPWVPNDRPTIAWTMTCDCPIAKPVPCTVLDTFAGAATTLLVASRLGRNGIGIDLNADYTTMGRNRIHDDAPLFAVFK